MHPGFVLQCNLQETGKAYSNCNLVMRHKCELQAQWQQVWFRSSHLFEYTKTQAEIAGLWVLGQD